MFLDLFHCLPVLPLGVVPIIAASAIAAGGSIVGGLLSGMRDGGYSQPISTDSGEENYTFVVGRENKTATGSTPAASLPALSENTLAQNLIPLGVGAVIVVVALIFTARKK